MQNKTPTILVVEDEKSLMDAIVFTLKSCGFQVLSAYNVADALALLKKKQLLHAIWLDHYLNGDSGLEVLMAIKNDKYLNRIPVFLVSNTATEAKIYQYLQLGIKKYFVKTEENLYDIVKEIEKILQKKEK